MYILKSTTCIFNEIWTFLITLKSMIQKPKLYVINFWKKTKEIWFHWETLPWFCGWERMLFMNGRIMSFIWICVLKIFLNSLMIN